MLSAVSIGKKDLDVSGKPTSYLFNAKQLKTGLLRPKGKDITFRLKSVNIYHTVRRNVSENPNIFQNVTKLLLVY